MVVVRGQGALLIIPQCFYFVTGLILSISFELFKSIKCHVLCLHRNYNAESREVVYECNPILIARMCRSAHFVYISVYKFQ